MAEDPVCRELLSASGSLIIRENTGKFISPGPKWSPSVLKNFQYLLCFSQNSLVVGTGNFLARAGNCNSLLCLLWARVPIRSSTDLQTLKPPNACQPLHDSISQDPVERSEVFL